MATPTVPLSCAWAAPSRPKAPRATAAIVVVNVFKVVLPLVYARNDIISPGAYSAFFIPGQLAASDAAQQPLLIL
jgi:hypothetical protein